MTDYTETISLDAFLVKVQVIFLLGIIFPCYAMIQSKRKLIDYTRLRIKIVDPGKKATY